MVAERQVARHAATRERAAAPSGAMFGIGLTAAGYVLFSGQDAAVKWLATGFAVPQILFTRSIVIVALAFAFGGPPALRQALKSPNKAALGLRACLILAAWMLFYTASRRLGLAELTTLYFAAPVIAVVLAVVVLRERVDAGRWSVVALGFVGVAVAAGPTGRVEWLPAVLALAAACCWGCSVILVRLIGRTDTTTTQVLVSNALFALACAPMLFWLWKTPDPFSLALMVGVGVAGGLGQFLVFEGFRHAPASVVAPVEYTGLVWAFAFGYAIWGDVPRVHVFAGAGLIAASSLALVWRERSRPGAALIDPRRERP